MDDGELLRVEGVPTGADAQGVGDRSRIVGRLLLRIAVAEGLVDVDELVPAFAGTLLDVRIDRSPRRCP